MLSKKICSLLSNIRNILVIAFIVASFITPFLSSSKIVWAQTGSSAALSLNTPRFELQEGEQITVSVKVSSPSQSINAVSGSILYPAHLVRIASLQKGNSIINLWTREPSVLLNTVQFEGVILNPGFQGTGGLIFTITFEAKKAGAVSLNFQEGAVLANDGFGTNVLTTLEGARFSILKTKTEIPPGSTIVKIDTKEPMPPIITKYFTEVGPNEIIYIRGKGEPRAITKIIFENVTVQSLGEKFIAFLQDEKEILTEVTVRNDEKGIFHYVSGPNLVAGVYSATPVLVNPGQQSADLPGMSIQILVNDSELVKNMVVLLNVLILLIPIIALLVCIVFIPWYSYRRMRLIRERMLLEEEKIELAVEELKHKSTTQNQ